MSTDYYEMLGVARDADGSAIKRAYRKLAMELHPDQNPDPGAVDQFRQITEAYEVLKDDETRQIYDQYGAEGLKKNHWQPQYASFGNISDILSAFFGDDLFGSMMGGAGPSQGATRGDSLAVSVQMSFKEAALGTQRDLEYDVVVACATCDGVGAKSEAGLTTCESCSGAGVRRTVARSLFGQVVQESVCPTCNGRGQRIVTPCDTCQGSGEAVEHREITVDIPAGIADGQRIRLTGRGNAGAMGGPAGNLYVDIAVENDDRFIREGDDLITAVDLTMTEAALGCVKPIDTVDGDIDNVQFDAGIQSGEILTLRGRGVGKLRGGGESGRGNMRIVVNVVVPRDLSSEQRDILEQFKDLENDRNYKSEESLLGKLRRVLRTHG